MSSDEWEDVPHVPEVEKDNEKCEIKVKARYSYKPHSAKLSNGIRSVGFKVTIPFDPLYAKKDKVLYNFQTRYEGFKASWTIQGSYDEVVNCFRWERFVLKKSNQSIYGSFEIRVKNGDGTEASTASTFHRPFIRDLWEIIIWRPGSPLEISMSIFYYDPDAEEMVLTSLSDDYDKLFQTKKFCDVTFVVGTEREEIPAHLAIVSTRNDVLAKTFDSDMIEKKKSRVEIPDIEPNVFKLLLRYIYSEKIDSDNTDDLLKLMVAADRYLMKDLVHISAVCIKANFSPSNVIDALLITDLLGADLKFLKDKCIRFIIERKKDVVDTENYKEMVNSRRADLLSEIFLATDDIKDETEFSGDLTIENVVRTLIIADRDKQEGLKQRCIQLMVNYKDEVSKTEDYKKMVKSGRADLLSEIFLQTITLADIFKMCFRF